MDDITPFNKDLRADAIEQLKLTSPVYRKWQEALALRDAAIREGHYPHSPVYIRIREVIQRLHREWQVECDAIEVPTSQGILDELEALERTCMALNSAA